MSQSKRIVVLFLLLVTGGILIFVSTRNDKTGEQRFVEGAAIQPSTSESSPIQIAQVQTVATPLAVHEIYRGKISDHHWKEVSIYYENGLPYPLRKEQILHQNADGETTVKSSVSYVANHILLGFTGDEVPDSIKELGDLKPIKSIAGHSSYILVLKDWSLDTVAGLVSRFAEEPFSSYLRYAEPDFVQEARLLPNDPLTMDGTQWSLWNTNNSEDINAAGGWDIRTTANDVVVAVIDTGVDSGHSDLIANLWNNPNEIPENGIDDDSNGVDDDVHGFNAITDSGDVEDDSGHGTHVSGIVGAVGNKEKPIR